jgi:hypothetical protein
MKRSAFSAGVTIPILWMSRSAMVTRELALGAVMIAVRPRSMDRRPAGHMDIDVDRDG